MLPDPRPLLRQIRDAGKSPALVVNPEPPVAVLEPYLADIDLALCMTVHPGFGGQAFITATLDKVRTGAEWRAERKLDYHIEVDGGINVATARASREAGANVMVAGTSIFKAVDVAGEIAALR